MANPKIKRSFRLIAIEETEHWLPTHEEIASEPIFGIYLYMEGEATYCASLTPSSWCEFLENRFLAHDKPGISEDAIDEMDELRTENGDESGSYFPFIRNPDPRCISKAESFTVDTRNCDGDTAKERRENAIKELWEEAREYFQGNSASIPIADDWRVCRDWHRESAKYIVPSLPLFHYARSRP